MAVPKSYKNHIAEGKGILVFSIAFAAIMRLAYFFWDDTPVSGETSGYLWSPISIFFENSFYSLIASTVCVAGLALIAAQINAVYLLIRRRTILPSAIIILLFSCHPSFIIMSPEYIGAVIIIFLISLLFGAYNSGNKQIPSFAIGFFLALASLFSPVLLLSFPFLWVGLAIMRCFNFKAFLATILGIVIVYFPTFSVFLFLDKLELFYAPFVSVTIGQLADLPLLSFRIHEWIVMAFSIIILGVIISDNYINRHKDKIKIRAYLSLLTLIIFTSYLLFLLLNINPMMNLYIVLIVGGLLFAHFFALAENKSTVILFYITGLFYFFVCLLPFLSL